MPEPADPSRDRSPSLVSRLVKQVILGLFRLKGWRAVGSGPSVAKGVIIAVPHTSNWDFVYYLGLTHSLGIRARFMAKDSLFTGAMGGFMRDMGGVPVERASKRNMVEQMVAEFAARDRFLLTIAPEGTRSSVLQWKTGFYHIAVQAGVPLIPGFVDYRRRVGGLGEPIAVTGDYAADMAKVRAFYEREVPYHPLYPGDGR
ncbi:acyltransferase [Altererythrobacter aurantiacus]|uniref:Acyltransferase n=1 Tax=Parapontixanthobacter aurantiacus TaxID=1463599 RepID=A0A844ZFM7_9SPHN|nr:lysophospholipid acyltransferase family protein [Parapontixanthobacter aurantiacus]MXO86665.1 acyltransferase [Parapontixanthobacter aurantiacus]